MPCGRSIRFHTIEFDSMPFLHTNSTVIMSATQHAKKRLNPEIETLNIRQTQQDVERASSRLRQWRRLSTPPRPSPWPQGDFFRGFRATILHYTKLYYTTLNYIILYYTTLYYTILYCTIPLCYRAMVSGPNPQLPFGAFFISAAFASSSSLGPAGCTTCGEMQRQLQVGSGL